CPGVSVMADQVCEFAWRKGREKPPPNSHTLSFCPPTAADCLAKDRHVPPSAGFSCLSMELPHRIIMLQLHLCATEFRSHRRKPAGGGAPHRPAHAGPLALLSGTAPGPPPTPP